MNKPYLIFPDLKLLFPGQIRKEIVISRYHINRTPGLLTDQILASFNISTMNQQIDGLLHVCSKIRDTVGESQHSNCNYK